MAVIDSLDRLTALIGEPRPAVAQKFHTRFTEQARAFLERAPLAFLATVDAQGVPMVSPKGDRAGFLRVEDDRTLLIPERSGNRLIYTLRNVLANGRLAVIAVLPGTGETFRLEGQAELDDDAALCASFTERGRPALVVMRLHLHKAYFHCAKSLLRAGAWDPSTWGAALSVSFGREIAENQGLDLADVAAFDQGVAARYRTDL